MSTPHKFFFIYHGSGYKFLKCILTKLYVKRNKTKNIKKGYFKLKSITT